MPISYLLIRSEISQNGARLQAQTIRSLAQERFSCEEHLNAEKV